MAARRQESKKLVAELAALAEELATARKPWPLREARRAFERSIGPTCEAAASAVACAHSL